MTEEQLEPLLYTKKQAAHLLSVSLRTIDNLIARRELPVRRLGRRVLISRRGLEQFLRTDHETQPQPSCLPVTGDRDATG